MSESVLLEFSMFPTDKGESKSEYVSRVLKVVKESGYEYQLTPMATIVEFDNIREAMELVAKAYDSLNDCNRVYSTLKFDIRKKHSGRMKSKIASIEKHIGEVKK
jgi:uncharacterized protein (TIGR00106 family)